MYNSGDSEVSLAAFFFFNYTAYSFNYIIYELSDGQWTEGIQWEYKDCQSLIPGAQ